MSHWSYLRLYLVVLIFLRRCVSVVWELGDHEVVERPVAQ